MAKNSQHINYTFTDIEKYLLNKMSATERHLMEKAALTDPFLTDAMEGYEAANLVSAKQHLSNISGKFTPQKEEKEYTLEDIERYLQGNMTATEMYAIEKAALKDPFLADAMEGYEEVDFSAAKQQMYIVSDKINSKEEQLPNYNFNDIEQYIEKKMPSTERHTMEKTALKEPFLSDAIEGYETSNLAIAKQHLTNIETAILGEEKEETKVVAMNAAGNNKMWLRIAAAIILMVGVGSTLWLANKKEAAGVTAYVEPPIIKEKPTTSAGLPSSIDSQNQKSTTGSSTSTNSDQPTISIPDTKTEVAAIVVETPKSLNDGDAKQTEKLAAPSREVASITTKEAALWSEKTEDKATDHNLAKDNAKLRKQVSDSFVIASNAANARKETAYYNSRSNNNNAIASAPQDKTQNGGYDFNANNAVRGRVVNREGQGVPYATLNINSNNRNFKPIVTDATGTFNINATDTLVNATVNVVGYEQQNTYLNAFRSNTVVLEKKELSLSEEVVTTGFGTKKKQVETTLGTPVGGLKSFEDYVSKKKETLKKDSTDDEEEYVEALVELEFDVDRLGKPYNISVTNSNNVDASVSTKAIKIVKEGPAWIADKKKKKAKVTIKL